MGASSMNGPTTETDHFVLSEASKSLLHETDRERGVSSLRASAVHVAAIRTGGLRFVNLASARGANLRVHRVARIVRDD
jgi:hypothetical protein